MNDPDEYDAFSQTLRALKPQLSSEYNEYIDRLVGYARRIVAGEAVAYPDNVYLRALPPLQRAARFRQWREGRR